MKLMILILSLILIPALILGGGTAFQLQAAEELQVQQQGEVWYVSGGVGEEERSQLDALSGRFNLKVVLALKTGNYLSDVALEIRDMQGSIVVSTVAMGPWFYAALPSGEYTIVAGSEGNQLERQVSVPDSGQREVTMIW